MTKNKTNNIKNTISKELRSDQENNDSEKISIVIKNNYKISNSLQSHNFHFKFSNIKLGIINKKETFPIKIMFYFYSYNYFFYYSS